MDQIFDLAYYTNGAFCFTELYEMPVNLRSYYYVKLVRLKEEEKARHEAANQK
jgi:hypothetical protein